MPDYDDYYDVVRHASRNGQIVNTACRESVIPGIYQLHQYNGGWCRWCEKPVTYLGNNVNGYPVYANFEAFTIREQEL